MILSACGILHLMKIINILTKGFDSPNGCAFLFPLIKNRRALLDRGIDISFYSNINNSIYDCDILIVESKYFSPDWEKNTNQVLEKFEEFHQKIKKIIYFDISDSSGFPHARVLPYVDAYAKNQLLKDRTHYLKPLYGHRLYTDYYHKHYGIKDKNPLYSEPIENPDLLKKLKLGWNSGLADYSLYGPYRMMSYRKIRIPGLLAYPRKYTRPEKKRMHDLSCRMGITYDRDSVAWQRREMRSKLKSFVLTNKLSRQQYYRELEASKMVISPFGLGEITLKDFEVFLTGGLLIKPDLTHMETWPNFFSDKKTMISVDWDLSNLEQQIQEIIKDYRAFIDIAKQGQAHYREYIGGDKASEIFCEHFKEIIETC